MAAGLSDLKLMETKTFKDDRGYFRETWRREGFDLIAGRETVFVQDNESLSRFGVVRGLHYQRAPFAQAKLVRVHRGSIFDVAVDIRPGSPDFGRWRSFELSSANGRALFVPEGFAHGFCALAEDTVVVYKVSAYYHPAGEAGIRWNDPFLGIDWPLAGASPVISAKDAVLPLWSEVDWTENG